MDLLEGQACRKKSKPFFLDFQVVKLGPTSGSNRKDTFFGASRSLIQGSTPNVRTT